MVKSMTGFGKGEATLQNKKITVEIRSLNSKQLDLGLRLPAVYRQSEYEIRNIITRTVQRGKVDVFVTVESQTVETPARINKEVFAAYAEQLRDAARNAQLNYAGIGWDSAALQAIMRLPFEKARTETVRARLLENLEKLQVDVDRNRLEQEMIFYLEKLDITEEKVRLANHCRYFREVAAQEEGAGRKLGFIAQEMGREINTMGSKANESNIQILVVKMKDELEKIKEQVRNIV